MTQQTGTKPQVVAWEPGEFDIVTGYGSGWQGYSVGSRDEAYAELQRIEEEKRPHVRHREQRIREEHICAGIADGGRTALSG